KTPESLAQGLLTMIWISIIPFKLYLKAWLMIQNNLLLTFRYDYMPQQANCQIKIIVLLYL
ncbi:MAG: hypothetical protein QM498_17035, partial [Desulfobacterium sp.]